MIWFIALGSAMGGVVRYLVGGAVQQAAGGTFPAGTLLVNVTGSFLLGFLIRYSADSAALGPELRAMLTIGFCGGYTTFSTFSYETVRLIEDGQGGRALAYALSSVLLSVGAAVLGLAAGRELLLLRRH
jgi:CrcB protein